MIAVELPASYAARPLRLADAPAVADLMAAHELAVLGDVLTEQEDITADWQRPSTDLEHRSTGLFAEGRLVAYGEVAQDGRTDVFVHPDHWGRGLGTALAGWSQAVGRAHRLEHVGQTVADADPAAQTLFAALGYLRRHTSWVLALPAERRIEPVSLPPGYAIRDFEPGHDEHTTYQVVEDAFNEWPDRTPQRYDEWAAPILGRAGFEPWQVRLVTGPDDDVAGACVLQLGRDSAWVHQLAVRPERRGQGLARALLSDAFKTARDRGHARLELSTDSRTGALGLYEHVGMQVTASFTHWRKTL